MDQKKWVDVSLGLVGLAVFWVAYHIIDSLASSMGWSLLADSPVGLGAICGVVVGVVVYILLKKNQKVFVFTEEVVNELSKVTWPARKETFISGAVVLVMVGIASIIMSLFDSIWGSLAQKILTF